MRQTLHAIGTINGPQVSHGYFEFPTNWTEAFPGPYNMIGVVSNKDSAKACCFQNFGLRDVAASYFIACSSWTASNPPTVGDQVDIWAFATDEVLNTPPEQFIHSVYQVTLQDVTNGYIVSPMTWATPFVGVYNLQTSFCYRSNNPPGVKGKLKDSRRSVVYDSGVMNVTNKGYQHILFMQPGNTPNVNDLIDFWGYGLQ